MIKKIVFLIMNRLLCIVIFLLLSLTGVFAQQNKSVEQIRNAITLLQNRQLDEAEKLLRQVAAAAPANVDAHNLLGIVLDQKGKAAEAESEFRAALRANPKAVSPLANLGVLLAKTKRNDEAIKILESVLRAAPNHPQATINLGFLFNLGIALLNTKNFDEAANAFENASTSNPNAAEPFYYLGLIAFERKQDEKADALFAGAIDLRANYAAANFMRGEISTRHQKYAEAKKFYELAVRQDPTQAVHHIRYGGMQILLKNFAQALEVFQTAAARFQNIAEIQYFTALAARGAANNDLAQTALQKSLLLKPNYPAALALSGAINLDRGNFAEAEKLLRRAAALDDKLFNAQYDLGRLLIKTNRYAEALPFLTRAASINPNNSDVHYQLYLSLSRLKRKEEASRELEIFKQLTEKQSE